jgi:hypothetical protein
VLHRVIVDVVKVLLEVVVVSDLVLPKLPLPHAATTVTES